MGETSRRRQRRMGEMMTRGETTASGKGGRGDGGVGGGRERTGKGESRRGGQEARRRVNP